MSSTGLIGIEAVVDDVERPALVAAAKQLGGSLSAASEKPIEVRLNFASSFEAIDTKTPSVLVIASLLPDVSRDESMASTEARWRRQLSLLAARPALSVLLCTVFRHVPRSASVEHTVARATTTERIRRLNLLATALSHDTGAGVIDIDRTFAHLGARALGTDYRFSGAVATRVAAHTIAWSVLSAGLDDAFAPEILERATQFLGPLWQIGDLLNRLRVQHA
jgi:hypothetical protein